MRGVTLWLSATALAFAATAGAFLMLANLGVDSQEKRIPSTPRSNNDVTALSLSLDEKNLERLEPEPDQRLIVGVSNKGGERLSDVNLTVEISSENTAVSEARYYRETLEELDAGASATVPFDIDLSPPERLPGSASTERAASIIEVRAATPAGVSAVRTAVLHP